MNGSDRNRPRDCEREPWLSMREVKRTTKTTLRSANRVVCSKKDLTEPTLLEITGNACQALRPRSYWSTLSSTQIPPDTFDIVSSNRLFVIDNATSDIVCGTIRLGRSKAETRNGSPAGLPFSGSK